MARPRVYEDLVTTSVTVSRKDLDLATSRGINVSELLRDALTLALGSVSGKLPQSRAKSRIKGIPVALKNKALSYVGRELCEFPDNAPKVAEHWSQEINRLCSTQLEPQDLIDLIPKC